MLQNNSSTYKYDIMYKKNTLKQKLEMVYMVFFLHFFFHSFTSFVLKKKKLGLKIFINWEKNKREIKMGDL